MNTLSSPPYKQALSRTFCQHSANRLKHSILGSSTQGMSNCACTPAYVAPLNWSRHKYILAILAMLNSLLNSIWKTTFMIRSMIQFNCPKLMTDLLTNWHPDMQTDFHCVGMQWGNDSQWGALDCQGYTPWVWQRVRKLWWTQLQ